MKPAKAKDREDLRKLDAFEVGIVMREELKKIRDKLTPSAFPTTVW